MHLEWVNGRHFLQLLKRHEMCVRPIPGRGLSGFLPSSGWNRPMPRIPRNLLGILGFWWKWFLTPQKCIQNFRSKFPPMSPQKLWFSGFIRVRWSCHPCLAVTDLVSILGLGHTIHHFRQTHKIHKIHQNRKKPQKHRKSSAKGTRSGTFRRNPKNLQLNF